MTLKAKLIPLALFLFLFMNSFISPVKAAEIILSMPDCEIELGQSSCLSKPSQVLNPKEGSSYTLKYFGPGNNITLPRTAYYTPANNWTHNPTGGAGTQIQINYNTGVGANRSTVRLYDMNDMVNYVYTARPKALCRSGLVWSTRYSRCEAGSTTSTPTDTSTSDSRTTTTITPTSISNYPANASEPQITAYKAIGVLDQAVAKIRTLINTTTDATLKTSAAKTLETAIKNRTVVIGIYNQADYYEAAKLAETVTQYINWFLKGSTVTPPVVATSTTQTPTLPRTGTSSSPISPISTTPTTPTDSNNLLALINQLSAQVAALQQQLLALQQGTTPTTPTTPTVPTTINLTQNLSRGSQGTEVRILQTALASLGYLDDENISGYFGPLTEAAVKKFQCDKNITCTGTVSTTGYGMVGPSTRTALIAAIGSGSGVTPINPIDPISPIVKTGPFKSFTATTKKSPNLAGFTEISLAWDASGSTYGGVRIKCSGTWTRGTEGGQPLVNATTVALGGLPPDTDTRVLTVQVANLTDGASLQENKTFSLKGRAIFNVADGIFEGTHNCVSEVVSGGARVGSTASASFTVNSAVSTGGTPTGPAATGLSCYNKDLYENGTLKQVCPKAPNGGIACQVSSGVAQCAGEGYVWINGKKVKWAGNTSGSCFADSACEANHECKSSTKMCVPKTLETTEDGGYYFQTWNQSKLAWGPKVLRSCQSGFKVSPTDTNMCIPTSVPVITSFTADKTEIYSNDAVTFSWTSTGATGCTLNGRQSVSYSGSRTQTLVQGGSPYSIATLTCKNSDGTSEQKQVQVNFKSNPDTPQVTLSASAATVDPGQPVTISWNTTDYVNDGTISSNGDGCHFTEPASLTDWTAGTGFTSKRATSGSVSYTINSDTTFKMWCRGSIRTAQGYSNELVVKVTPPPSVTFSVSEGGASLASWSGKSVKSELTVAGKGLVSCKVTNDDLSFYNEVYPSGHSVPAGYASAGFSVKNIDNYIVNYPTNLTLPSGFIRMTTEDYNLGKGTTYRATCTGIGGTTTKTDSF